MKKKKKENEECKGKQIKKQKKNINLRNTFNVASTINIGPVWNFFDLID